MPILRGPRPVYRCDVVVPYRNHLHWVPAAVDSVLWQNSVECVIHMVNDDSPEDDRRLRERYTGNARIRWYRNGRNLGPYRSVHQVWRFMQTEFFAVQDSDDVSYPNRLWYAIHQLEQTGAEIFGGCLEQFVEPSPGLSAEREQKFVASHPYWHSGQRWAIGSPHGILINGSVVMRRSLLQRMNGYHDLMCGGDAEFCTRIAHAGVKRVISDAVVGTRRVNSGSLSRGGQYAMGTPARQEIHERLAVLYREYGRSRFDPARYGCLDRADPSLTFEITKP